jgi:signal peptide peptidase SppA
MDIGALIAATMREPWAIRKDVLDGSRVALGRILQGHVPLGEMPGSGLLVPATSLHQTRAAIEPDEDDDEGDEDEDDDDDAEDDVEASGGVRAAVHSATERATARKEGNVAIIPVRGVISNRMTIFDWLMGTAPCSPGRLVALATAAVNDASIKAVIIDYDSPGGSVMGVQEAFDALFALRGKKPIIAQVSGQCCSAAYWMACGQDEIVATKSAVLPSLGVYMTHEDWSKYYAELGVLTTYIQKGEYKTEGANDKPLSEEALAHLDEMCGDYMDMFVGSVASGRGIAASVASGADYGQGRAYTAARCLTRGIIDKVRDLPTTLATYGVDPSAPDPQARRGRGTALLRMEVDALDL